MATFRTRDEVFEVIASTRREIVERGGYVLLECYNLILPSL